MNSIISNEIPANLTTPKQRQFDSSKFERHQSNSNTFDAITASTSICGWGWLWLWLNLWACGCLRSVVVRSANFRFKPEPANLLSLSQIHMPVAIRSSPHVHLAPAVVLRMNVVLLFCLVVLDTLQHSISIVLGGWWWRLDDCALHQTFFTWPSQSQICHRGAPPTTWHTPKW